jgi:hypothetical protein
VIFLASRDRGGGSSSRSRGYGGSRSRGGGSRSRGGGLKGRGSRSSGGSSRYRPLIHIEVVFLPPNTTSYLQPLDAGIIANFKNYFKRKYCHHMLGLFEDGKDINKEKINIKEAINYVAEAWDHVTEETIRNCWKKTGILPSLTNKEIDDVIQIQQEMMDDDAADIGQMINELDMDDPAAALLADKLYDFFQDLEEIPTEEILSDDDIVRLIQDQVNENDENDSDSEEEQILVPPNDALKSLQTWITFFEQQEIDEFSIEDMKIFEKYFKIVKRLEHQSRKQVSITDFF